jgi:2-polyprenyl-3-methyl-5-hydroxy-6-metoxy-1,4-benzoquinol methylase
MGSEPARGDDYARFREANRAYWNERIGTHVRSEHYDAESFRQGRLSLMPLEIEELGPVSGKRLLHLQCHFGLDTLSWARLGAEVTGVDLSDEAIRVARVLASETKVPGRFVASDIMDLVEALPGEGGGFDFVFTSYGVLDYLPDMGRWAKIVAHFLRPGGVFYMAEIHPFALVFDHGPRVPKLELKHPYSFTGGQPGHEWGRSQRRRPVEWDATDEPTFTGGEERFEHNKAYSWNHGIGEVVTSLIRAGLALEFLHEWPYGCYEIFPFMQRDAQGYYRLNTHDESVPLLYSLRARKPG